LSYEAIASVVFFSKCGAKVVLLFHFAKCFAIIFQQIFGRAFFQTAILTMRNRQSPICDGRQ